MIQHLGGKSASTTEQGIDVLLELSSEALQTHVPVNHPICQAEAVDGYLS